MINKFFDIKYENYEVIKGKKISQLVEPCCKPVKKICLQGSQPGTIQTTLLNYTAYGKCSNYLNTFLTPFSKKILVINAGIHQMPVRIASREDPDQTASAEAI